VGGWTSDKEKEEEEDSSSVSKHVQSDQNVV
jgi:hypothetical protein